MASFNSPAITNPIATDIPAIQALLTAAIKWHPDEGNHTNIPSGAKRINEGTSGQWTVEKYNGSKWVSVGKLMNDVDTVDGKHVSTTASSGAIPVYNSSKALPGDVTGNAASASKLKTSRGIRIGGIGETLDDNVALFNGLSDITVPLDKVYVNTDNDDAVVGVLTTAHGGTGNDKGVASDVSMTVGGVSYNVKEYGGIGAIVVPSNKDLNALLIPGKYFYAKSYATVENHFPESIGVSCIVEVHRNGSTIFQTITYSDAETSKSGVWVRQGTTSSFGRWNPVSHDSCGSIIIYISKSGNDINSGLSSDYPVASFERAFDIADASIGGQARATVNLYVEGDSWGNVTIANKPYTIHVAQYSGGKTETTYNASSMPSFTTITFENVNAAVYGIVANQIVAQRNAYVFMNYYNRIGSIVSKMNSMVQLSTNTRLDVFAQSTNATAVFQTTWNGTILFDVGTNFTIKLITAVSKTYFLYIGAGCHIEGTDVLSGKINTSSYAFTGQKIYIHRTGIYHNWDGESPTSTAIPGDKFTFQSGANVNGLIYGDGSTTKWLRADGTWQTIGTGNGTTTGLLKLSDSTSSTSGVSGGIAATPAAVKAAYDAATAASSNADGKLPLTGGTLTGGITMPSLELTHATPFIDFHFNKSTADYTTRIIEEASGRLTCSGQFHILATNQSSLSANSGGFSVGNRSAHHVVIGYNTLMAKATDTTAGTLYVNHLGGSVLFGSTTALTTFKVNGPATFTSDVTASGVVKGMRLSANNSTNNNIDFVHSSKTSNGYYLAFDELANNTTWSKIITERNIGSQSVNYASSIPTRNIKVALTTKDDTGSTSGAFTSTVDYNGSGSANFNGTGNITISVPQLRKYKHDCNYTTTDNCFVDGLFEVNKEHKHVMDIEEGDLLTDIYGVEHKVLYVGRAPVEDKRVVSYHGCLMTEDHTVMEGRDVKTFNTEASDAYAFVHKEGKVIGEYKERSTGIASEFHYVYGEAYETIMVVEGDTPVFANMISAITDDRCVVQIAVGSEEVM